MSNNDSFAFKIKHLSFINRFVITLLMSLPLVLIIPYTVFLFEHWSKASLLVKIGWSCISAIVLVGIISVPFNGMFISKKGTITFIPDFRIKRVHISKLKRVAVNFNEWDNYRYSVTVKLVYKDGGVFIKDYSNQFANSRKRSFLMRFYTIADVKVNDICGELSRSNLFNISIIDLRGNIIYQNKNDKQSF